MNFDSEYEQIKDSQLEVVELGERTQTFYLKKYPDSRMMSTLLVFTPENIVITGDLSPGRYGVISCIGYGIGWFGTQKNSYYLAEKFLDKCYESERAHEDAREYLLERATDAWENRDREAIEKARKLRDYIDENESWMFDNGYELYEHLSMHDPWLVDDGLPFGWDYPTADFCWLAAIQKRFSEVYQEWLKTDQGKEFISRGKK